jgi:hypothetical protein
MRRHLMTVAFGAVLAGCAFDPNGATGVRPCATPSDCQPDETCYHETCVLGECTAPADCGAGYQFACEQGLCRTITCIDGCGTGYACGLNGFCTPAGCVPAVEGPPGSASCLDGIDNDCDGLTDADDPNCHACSTDGECDDGRPCNGVERCVQGQCESGPPLACGPSGDACQQLVCDDLAADGPCVPRPVTDGTDCDDGDACTSGDHCTAGACGGTAYSCAPAQCQATSVCDGAGGCTTTPKADGTGCDDGEPCTKDDHCTGGVCGGTAYDCTPTDCQATSVCDGAGGCTTTPKADGTGCDDGEPCTKGDTCTGGVCGGTAYTCTPTQCQATSVCDGAGGCTTTPKADGTDCDDGQACTHTDKCTGGLCGGTPYTCTPAACEATSECDGAGGCTATPKSCGDAYSCTVDSCAADGSCVHTPNDALCGAHQVCRPACFGGASGCGTAPTLARVACPTPWHVVSASDSCTVSLGALTGQQGCVQCSAWAGTKSALYTDFFDGGAGCQPEGWTTAATTGCPGTLCYNGGGTLPGTYAVYADKGQCTGGAGPRDWWLSRTVDTTGMTGVTVCFDYASEGAGANDYLELDYSASGTGGTWTALYHDQGGPGAQDQWVRTCVLLPADADDNATLGLQFTLQSNANNHRIYLDNIEVFAYVTTCTTRTTVFASDFAACATTDWTVTGAAPVCPAMNGADALEANNSTWTISRTLDTRGLEGDLVLRFDVAETTNVTTADSLVVEMNTAGTWQRVFAVDGPIRTDQLYSTYVVNLSQRDPVANQNAALGLRLTATSGTAGHRIDLDNVRLDAVRFTCAASGVTFGAVGDAGSGSYTVPVSSSTVGQTQIECSWDQSGLDVNATGSLQFVP